MALTISTPPTSLSVDALFPARRSEALGIQEGGEAASLQVLLLRDETSLSSPLGIDYVARREGQWLRLNAHTHTHND